MNKFNWSWISDLFNAPKPAKKPTYLSGRNLRRVKRKSDAKGKNSIRSLSERLFSKEPPRIFGGETNHERVVRGRAHRMGLTVQEYMAKYPKTKGMK